MPMAGSRWRITLPGVAFMACLVVVVLPPCAAAEPLATLSLRARGRRNDRAQSLVRGLMEESPAPAPRQHGNGGGGGSEEMAVWLWLIGCLLVLGVVALFVVLMRLRSDEARPVERRPSKMTIAAEIAERGLVGRRVDVSGVNAGCETRTGVITDFDYSSGVLPAGVSAVSVQVDQSRSEHRRGAPVREVSVAPDCLSSPSRIAAAQQHDRGSITYVDGGAFDEWGDLNNKTDPVLRGQPTDAGGPAGGGGGDRSGDRGGDHGGWGGDDAGGNRGEGGENAEHGHNHDDDNDDDDDDDDDDDGGGDGGGVDETYELLTFVAGLLEKLEKVQAAGRALVAYEHFPSFGEEEAKDERTTSLAGATGGSGPAGRARKERKHRASVAVRGGENDATSPYRESSSSAQSSTSRTSNALSSRGSQRAASTRPAASAASTRRPASVATAQAKGKAGGNGGGAMEAQGPSDGHRARNPSIDAPCVAKGDLEPGATARPNTLKKPARRLRPAAAVPASTATAAAPASAGGGARTTAAAAKSKAASKAASKGPTTLSSRAVSKSASRAQSRARGRASDRVAEKGGSGGSGGESGGGGGARARPGAPPFDSDPKLVDL